MQRIITKKDSPTPYKGAAK